jgi:hypothetical protein
MSMKLVQKQFLKGRREFEIVDDSINVRIKALFKEEKISVMLMGLNPDPIINGPFLEFHSRVQNGPILALLLNRPCVETFNRFVNELKRRAREEFNAFAGLKTGVKIDRLAGNVYEEPAESDLTTRKVIGKSVSVENIVIAIQMLSQYMDAEEINPLLSALEAIKEEPENESNLGLLVETFDNLGPLQGAVLTYAPYVNFLLTDDSFGS